MGKMTVRDEIKEKLVEFSLSDGTCGRYTNEVVKILRSHIKALKNPNPFESEEDSMSVAELHSIQRNNARNHAWEVLPCRRAGTVRGGEMSKLNGEIIWLEDSEIYLGNMKFYKTGADFLKAVIKHIQRAVDGFTEQECGWCKVPVFESAIKSVKTSYMVHRLNSEWHDSPFWEHIEESGKGHVHCWFIDFAEVPKDGFVDPLCLAEKVGAKG